MTGGGGGREIRHFSNKSTTKKYFKILISHIRHLLLAPFLLQRQNSPTSFLQAVKRESVYSEPEPIKYVPNWAAILSRLHYILQATSLLKTV